MKKTWLRYILVGLFFALAIMQLFPIDKTNPPVDLSKDYITLTNPPAQIATILKNACYDCHSHTTKYPWYTSVAPVSWWVKEHIDNGRKHFNLSTWGDYSPKRVAHKLEEAVEFVEETKMPLLSYIIAHPEARISEQERAELVAWFRGQM